MDMGLAHLVSWSEQTKGDVPPPLTGPSITISPLGGTIFLFGGKSVQTRRLTSEMWAMDIATRVWQRIDTGDGPGPRYFHSMDVWQDKLVCFGGMSDSDPMSVHNDIWFFDCSTRQWLQPHSPLEQDPNLIPSARYAHLSAISNGQLVVSGGQHSDNSWIYEINVYDLQRKFWVSKTEQPEMQGQHSKGAYRSVTTSAKQRVIVPPLAIDAKAAHTYSVDEEGEGGDVYCYSNYDFAKVRRELEVISTDLSIQGEPSDKHRAPPSFAIRDEASNMHGSSQPPGLRFPTGGIVGNHFILCGLYLASSSAAFSIWALNLSTMMWKHLEPAVLTVGSWNRAIVWPEQARILVFGNTSHDLASDYSRRAVNLDNVAVISLEAYGIYQPPKLEVLPKSQQVGLSMLDEKLASDFDVVSEDGRKIRCSRRILRDRWAWFAQQEEVLAEKLNGVLKEAPALDINDTLLGPFTPARLTPTILTIPEQFPVCVALVQYFYTLSLSSPLQNRAPVLSALLFLSKQYKIDRLRNLVVHALHQRLEPAIAVGVYEIATLAGEQHLQVRALNMIHAAKASSSRSGSYRHGPASQSAGEAGSNSTPSNAPSSNAGVPGSNASSTAVPRGGPIDDGPYRRARADSITVPMDILLAEEIDDPAHGAIPKEKEGKVHELLEALAVKDLPRRKTSIPSIPGEEATGPRTRNHSVSTSQSRPRYPLRPTPLLAPSVPPPTGRLPSIPGTPELGYLYHAHRPSSPTNSDVTSNFPSTPSETVRDSWLAPTSMDSRSSSSSGYAHHSGLLHTLPEVDGFASRQLRRSERGAHRYARLDDIDMEGKLDPATLENAGMITLNPNASPPPTEFGSHQARAISSKYDSSTNTRDRQMSIESQSEQREMNLTVPETPLSTNFDLASQAASSPSAYSTTGLTMPISSDSFSINSGSTGLSGKSAKVAAKAELKAIREAEKYHKKEEAKAKKAEEQAKFEAARKESFKRMEDAERRFEALVAENDRKLALQKAEEKFQKAINDTSSPEKKQKKESTFKLGEKKNVEQVSTTGSLEEFGLPLPSALDRIKSTSTSKSTSDSYSISSGSTGTSSQKLAKAEFKAIREAEKEEQKREAKMRFEILRAEQMKKTAIVKAEAQRKADIEKYSPTPAPSVNGQPNTKWGKLKKGFTENALIPL